jgi:hypothetical protein
MKRAIMTLGFALAIGLATPSHAQYLEDDRDEPQPYTDEDSQILKGVSYLFSPVGVAIEWTVARPLYYLATKSPLAPVLGASREDDIYGYSGGTITEAPHSQYSRIAPIAPISPAERQPAPPPIGAAGEGALQPSAPSVAPSPAASQPVLH